MTKRRIISIITALLLGIGVAVALEAPASAGTYPHTISVGGYCLEVPNAARAANEQLWLNWCTGAANQVFNFDDAGRDWWYFLRPSYNTRLCLQAGAPGLWNSTIIQYPCNWSSPQIYVLGRANDGGYVLSSPYNGWCLGVDYAYAGAYVRQGSCANIRAHWSLG